MLSGGKLQGRARVRRTQRERSKTTQARLLEATVEVLAEVGWARLTTAAICERAGLTRGAQLHHFPTKAALVDAAVRRLTEQVLTGFDEGLNAIRPEGDPLAQFLDGVWRTLDGPLFEVGLELVVAARSDPDLRRALEPATVELRAATDTRVRRVAAALHPAAPEALEPVLYLSVHLVQAFGLDRLVSPRLGRSRALFEAWSEIVRGLLAGARRFQPPRWSVLSARRASRRLRGGARPLLRRPCGLPRGHPTTFPRAGQGLLGRE